MASLFAAFGIETHLLLAQLVNFGLLLLALWYFLYRPVMRTLDERRAVVAKGVEDAQEASAALSGATQKAGEIARAAEADAEGIVARAREEAGAERDRLVADAHDATPSQIALAYLLRHPNVVAIPGASGVEQVERNAAAAEIDLADDEHAALVTAAHAFRPVTGLAAVPKLIRARTRR